MRGLGDGLGDVGEGHVDLIELGVLIELDERGDLAVNEVEVWVYFHLFLGMYAAYIFFPVNLHIITKESIQTIASHDLPEKC